MQLFYEDAGTSLETLLKDASAREYELQTELSVTKVTLDSVRAQKAAQDLAATEVPAKTVWWTHGKWSEDKGFQPVLYEEAYDVAGPTVLPRQAVGEDL